MKATIAILALLSVAMCTTPRMNLQATHHYEDPFLFSEKPICTGSREVLENFDGLDGHFACMPEAFGDNKKECYQDFPAGTLASTSPSFKGKDKKIRCFLSCSGGGCGPRAVCQNIPNSSFYACMYKKKK